MFWGFRRFSGSFRLLVVFGLLGGSLLGSPEFDGIGSCKIGFAPSQVLISYPPVLAELAHIRLSAPDLVGGAAAAYKRIRLSTGENGSLNRNVL